MAFTCIERCVRGRDPNTTLLMAFLFHTNND